MGEPGIRKKVPLGRYRELGMPESWLEVLEACRPFEASLAVDKAPDLNEDIEQVFSQLDPRTREIIYLRFGFADGTPWTLEDVGQKFGLTRERVRQLQMKAIRNFCLEERLRSILKFLLPKLFQQGMVVLRMPDHQQLRNGYTGITGALGLKTKPLSPSKWAVFTEEFVQNPLPRILREEPRFYTLDEAVEISGIPAYDLLLGHGIFDGVYLTVGATFGSLRWTIADRIEAVALELAESGVRDWHFSQMAQALRYLYPEEAGTLKSRNVAAILARPGERFQHVGAKGVWRLASLGDGFATTKEAVLSLLAQSDLPLHYSAIVPRLARGIRAATVYALLSRETDFRNFGSGFYGLTGREYPEVSSFEEEGWLLELLGPRDFISFEEVDRVAEGFDPSRLRAVANLSKKLNYNAKANTLERIEFCYRRRFERWFANRFELGLPEDAVLIFGVRECISQGDASKLSEIAGMLGYSLETMYRLVGEG